MFCHFSLNERGAHFPKDNVTYIRLKYDLKGWHPGQSSQNASFRFWAKSLSFLPNFRFHKFANLAVIKNPVYPQQREFYGYAAISKCSCRWLWQDDEQHLRTLPVFHIRNTGQK